MVVTLLTSQVPSAALNTPPESSEDTYLKENTEDGYESIRGEYRIRDDTLIRWH